jgi:hypothetical protein
MAAAPSSRANNTWLIDYTAHVEQSLADLTAWVEHGAEPAGTAFDLCDGQIVLPSTARERGGIQPVVQVTADGSKRAEVSSGTAVDLAVHAEVPPGAGTVIGVKWDLDGSGTYPVTQDVDGQATEVTLGLQWTYDRPGTYFPTALVESHRDGDVAATSRRISNLDSARVIVS